MARETWTDERLDDLTKRMDKGFDRVDEDIRELRARMDKGFDEVKGEVREVRGEVRDLRLEMNAMQRTMVIGFVTLIGTVVASVLGGVLITQL